MKFGVMVGLALAMSATSVMAMPAPTWDRFPHLICYSTSGATCDPVKGSCTVGPLSVLWDVNFASGEVSYLNDKTSTPDQARDRIVAKNQDGDPRMSVSTDTVFLTSSRMMTFINLKDDTGRNMEVHVVAQFGGNTRIVTLMCSAAK